MSEIHFEVEPQITSESLPLWREKVASTREIKGKDTEALNMARKVRAEAMKLGEHEHVVNLYWEEYLIGKHLLMATRNEEMGAGDRLRLRAQGFLLMRNTSKAAFVYIEKHNVENLRPRSHRFLGKMDMLTKRYGKAIEHFSTGVELFQKMDDPVQRVNALELSGFLAEAMILSGFIPPGIDLAVNTFSRYDEGDGAELRDRDYYTWAVWKSGCATKLWNAFIEKGVKLSGQTRRELTQMLDSANECLVFPDGASTWGDKNFAIRKQEISSIKRRYRSL